MNTVPTLCATSCSIGIAAVGYTLGRVERPPLPRKSKSSLRGGSENSQSKRHSSISLSTFGSTHSSRPSTPFSRLLGRSSRNTYIASNPESDRSNGTMSVYQHHIGKHQDNQIADISATTALDSVDSPSQQAPAITSSQAGLGTSLRSPKAFSNTTTAGSESARVRTTPNKLIKRSVSRRVSTLSTSSTVSHMNRQASSDAKDQSYTKNTVHGSMSLPINKTDLLPNESHSASEPSHLQFFAVTIPSKSPSFIADITTQKRPTTNIRRISPNSGHQAALVLASSVHPKPEVIVGRGSEAEDSVPSPHRDLSNSNKLNSPHASVSPAGIVSESSSTASRLVRRSLSHGAFSSPPSAWTGLNKVQNQRRRLTRRVSSGVNGNRASAEQKHRSRSSSDCNLRQRRLPKEETMQSAGQSSIAQSDGKGALEGSKDPRNRDEFRRTPPRDLHTLSTSATSTGPRPTTVDRSRPSTTPSEMNSSFMGSDRGARVFSSGSEADIESRSDTLFDSHRSVLHRGATGNQRAPLDGLFDPGPDIPENFEILYTKAGSNTASPRLQAGKRTPNMPARQVMTTPIAPSSSETPNFSYASPSDLPTWSDDEDWDAEFADSNSRNSPLNYRAAFASVSFVGSSPRSTQPIADHEAKNNLFDWSEQPPIERVSTDRTPPRPKTVHGKKDTTSRTSRSGGRHAPTAMHARSHSVPALPDVEGKRTNLTQKFGTWGVGSKGVTEDWNEDFEFEDELVPVDSSKIVSGSSPKLPLTQGEIAIPSSIRDRQTRVIANISLLREWGMYIEELKELRARAQNIGAQYGEHGKTFAEADAMIELADQEAEHEDIGPESPWTIGSTQGDNEIDTHLELSPSQGPRRQSERRSIDVGDGASPPTEASSPAVSSAWTTPRLTGRPRKNSELLARSVIEALHKRVEKFDGEDVPTTGKQRKVPFDTATLKHIVPYVGLLNSRVKQALRELEGLDQGLEQPTRASPYSETAGPSSIAAESPARRTRLSTG